MLYIMPPFLNISAKIFTSKNLLSKKTNGCFFFLSAQVVLQTEEKKKAWQGSLGSLQNIALSQTVSLATALQAAAGVDKPLS